MEFVFDDDPDRIDLGLVWRFLSTDAYWGRQRSEDDVRRQVEGAWRVVGAYRVDGPMVGFARAFSDGVATAYLADVFVTSDARGHGVGVGVVRHMIEHGPGRDFRWMLHTDDAHDLYARFGFTTADHTYMEGARRRT